MVNRMLGKRAKKEKRGFNYVSRTTDQIKKRVQQTSGKFDTPFIGGVSTFRPKNGENVIRILPPTWDNHEHWGYDLWVHSYVGPGNGTYPCPLKMKGERCPICEASADAKAAGEKELGQELEANRRVVAWVIDRSQEDEGPKIWAMSWSQDRDISAQCIVKRGKALLIDHPDEGFDVIMQRTGQKLNTRYFGWNIDRESTPISDDEDTQDKWLSYVEENPIPATIRYFDEEYLQKVMEGTQESKDEDLDDDEEEEKKKERPRRKGKGKRQDEDEYEARRPHGRRARDDEDEDDEEEEDEKPRRRGRRDEDEKPKGRRARVEDDEKEEPEEEEEVEEGSDEDDEDEKPRSRPSKKRRGTHDDEDDGDDGDEKEEEDDEDERPRKGKSNRIRRSEPEPEDDEDDEEEEKPRKSSTKRTSSKRSRDDEDEDDEEEEEKPRKRTSSRQGRGRGRDEEKEERRTRSRAQDDEDEEDEDEEDEKPRRRRAA